MDARSFFDALMAATCVKDVEKAVATWRTDHPGKLDERPVGRNSNNRGAIEVATDAGRSLIERVTNAHDALLELEFHRHRGKPECRSPREAASAWLGVPEKEGLSGLTVKQRQDLAANTIVRLEPGEGWQSRIVTVIDRGIGITPYRMGSTILSLNESNKIQKHYLAGTYGQGGSSTFAFSKYVLIASRHFEGGDISFTVVRYLDLPAEEFKTGHYVYLIEGETVPVVKAKKTDSEFGTVVRHFGYDLTNYTSSIGPKSIYGALQRILFDPIAPIRFENQVHGWNRVIKGSRNALNGAVDQGDETTRGPELDYNVPLFSVSLGDHGTIGVEYWVLKRPTDDKGKARRNPADAFVDSKKPIVLSHNGQNHGELSALLLKRDTDLPYLRNRLIVHVNCDHLTPSTKRLLFASTREQSREGYILSRIQEEVIRLLRADDELARLNEEAREQSLKEEDHMAEQQMRRQVAKLLRIAGAALAEVGGSQTKEKGQGRRVHRGPRVKPEPIALKDPPTYIKIVWDEEREITFYGGQRRYLRVETDANSEYHDANDQRRSRINIAVGGDLKVVGTSPLRGGRMRIGIECSDNVAIDSKGSIRVELYRPGLSTLSDEQGYSIVEQPKPKDENRQSTFPEFKVVPVAGPSEDEWEYVCDNSNDVDIDRHASAAVMNGGVLYIYYSTVFSRFVTEQKRLAQQNAALAKSFIKRYELWLAVHALLVYQENKEADYDDDDRVKEMERQERRRLATIAAMVATQEVKSGVNTEDLDAAA